MEGRSLATVRASGGGEGGGGGGVCGGGGGGIGGGVGVGGGVGGGGGGWSSFTCPRTQDETWPFDFRYFPLLPSRFWPVAISADFPPSLQGS